MTTKSGYQHKKSFKGHEDVVNCFLVAKIPLTQGGKQERECLFTASSDKSIKQWDLETNALLCTFKGAETEVKKNALDHLLSGGAETRKTQQGHEQGVCCLAFAKGFLYSGSFDSRIIKWDLLQKAQKSVFLGHQEAVYRIATQDVWLLSVSRDTTVRVWNETSGQCIAILKGHSAPILSLAVADRVLYTGSDDCSIRQWEWHSGAQTREYHGHTDGITDLTAAGEHLYSCSFDSTVRMWGIKSGQCMRICNADAGLRGLAIAAGKIFGAGNNAMLYIWDQNSTSSEPLAADRLARAGLTMVAVDTGKGGGAVLASSADGAVRMWEKVSVVQATTDVHDDDAMGSGPMTTAPLAIHGGPVEEETEEVDDVDKADAVEDRDLNDVSEYVVNQYKCHKDKVHACYADSESGMLYTASSDNSVCCSPIASGVPRPGRHQEEFVLKEHTDRVLAITITGGADGKVLLTASADKTVRKWDLNEDGAPKKFNSSKGAYESTARFEGHTDWVSCLVVAEGSLFSGSWDSSIRKWDISTNRFIAELLGHHDPLYCLCAVGGVLLSGSRDCTVRAWRTDTCECIRVYEGHTAVVSSLIAVDPLLYTASWDKTIRKWDLATGKCRIFAELEAPVLCLLESKDKLVAGCGNAKVSIFNKESQQEELVLEQHGEAVNALSGIPGNGVLSLFSASNDATCIQWEVEHLGDGAGGGDPGSATDPSLSAALAERICGSGDAAGGKQGGANSLSTALNRESQFLTQTQLDAVVPDVVKGWLWKQGAVFKRWSKRFYTLDKGLLLNYPDEQFDTRKPLDHLVMNDLISATADDAVAARGRSHGFTLVTLNRTIHLAADSSDELKEWLAALAKYVNHNNLKKKIAQKRATRKY